MRTPRLRPLGLRTRLAAVTALTLVSVGGLLLLGGYLALDRVLPRDVESGWIDTNDLAAQFVSSDPTSANPTSGEATGLDAGTLAAVNSGVGAYRDEVLREVVRLGLIGLVAGAVLVAGVSALAARRTLAPIRALARTAERLGEDGPWDARIPVTSSRDEGGLVAEAFNAMLERIAEGRRRDRLLVANLAHELRTPLASQRTVLEVALGADHGHPSRDELVGAARSALIQNERTAHLAESMLDLVAAGEGPVAAEAIDLADLTARVVQDVQDVTAAATGLRWDVDLAPAALTGDAMLWERAIANLVTNAVHHNLDGPDGWVTVTTATEADAAVVRVSNSGPIVDPSTVDGLVAPLARGGSARGTGGRRFGLGLAIVRTVSERHGAELSVRARPAGGLDVVIHARPTT